MISQVSQVEQEEDTIEKNKQTQDVTAPKAQQTHAQNEPVTLRSNVQQKKQQKVRF